MDDVFNLWLDEERTKPNPFVWKKLMEDSFEEPIEETSTIYRYHEAGRDSQKTLRILRETTEVLNYSYVLFGKDKDKAYEWLIKKNSFFFNMSPITFIFAGKGKTVVGRCKELLGIE